MNTRENLMCAGLVGLVGVMGYLSYDKFYEEPKRKEIQTKTETERKIAETKEMLRDLQDTLKRHELVENAAGSYMLNYPSSLEELQERAGYSDKKLPFVDAWGNRFNYRRQQDDRFFNYIEGKTVFYRDEHYELSSSGPDGISQTSDDVQAWYIPNHEWGSIERLRRQFLEAMKEANRSGLEKWMDKLGYK